MSQFKLPRRVDFENLMALRLAGERHIDAQAEPEFDLSELQEANSAGVALLVAWFRYAHVHGKVVAFQGVPNPLMNIIEVSELAAVLPLTT